MIDEISNLCYFLSAIVETTDKRISKLETTFGSIQEAFRRWKSAKAEIIHIIGSKCYQKGLNHYSLKEIKEHREQVEKLNIKVLTRFDKGYPDNLSRIEYDRVNIIYYVGDLNLFSSRCISVVGTRDHSSYGTKMTKEFCVGLVGAGLTIVSGLALGIDTIAHRAALESNGKTIAVLGSGLKKLAPRSNALLAREIARNGIVMSEYSPFTSGAQHTYPERNRIIAALSEGVVLIESHESSGAHYTCNYALEYGRHLFCLPGNADSLRSRGNLNYIRNGHSALVYNYQQILDELNVEYSIKSPQKDKFSGLDSAELQILRIIDKGEQTYDSLAIESEIDIKDLTGIIFSLQLKGLIQVNGNIIKIS